MLVTAKGTVRHNGVELTTSEYLDIKLGGNPPPRFPVKETPSGRTMDQLAVQPINPFKGIKAKRASGAAALSKD